MPTGAAPTWSACQPGTGCTTAGVNSGGCFFGALLNPGSCPAGYHACQGSGIASLNPCCVPPAPPAGWVLDTAVFPHGGVRNCTFGGCAAWTPPFGGPLGPCWNNCECAFCPPGFNFDGTSQYCCSTTPCCPAGLCFCAATGSCIDCPDPPCKTQRSCTWDALSCGWSCTDCPPGQCFYYPSCECTTGKTCAPWCWWSPSHCDCECCPTGKCWCETSGGCVDCQTDRSRSECFTERGCVWNSTPCRYDCTDPTCPPGQVFNLDTCRCEDDHHPPPPTTTPCDLLQADLGGIYRASRSGTSGTIEVVHGPDFVGGVLTVAADLATDAAPTLCRLARDEVLYWYHTAGNQVGCQATTDGGGSWAPLTDLVPGITLPAGRFPRAAGTFGRLWLVVHDGTAFQLYHSEGLEAFQLSDAPPVFDAENGRPCLFTDGRDLPHLVYVTTGGYIVHRYYDGETWSEATRWVAGTAPAYFPAHDRGALAYWTNASTPALAVRLVDSDGLTLLPRAIAPPGDWTRSYMGLLASDQGHQFWLGALLGSSPALRVSGDWAAAADTWLTP